jgi:hypothetical protein
MCGRRARYGLRGYWMAWRRSGGLEPGTAQTLQWVPARVIAVQCVFIAYLIRPAEIGFDGVGGKPSWQTKTRAGFLYTHTRGRSEVSFAQWTATRIILRTKSFFSDFLQLLRKVSLYRFEV